MIQIALNLGIVLIDWPRNHGAKRTQESQVLEKVINFGGTGHPLHCTRTTFY